MIVDFINDGTSIYGLEGNAAPRVLIATAVSESWAGTISAALNDANY